MIAIPIGGMVSDELAQGLAPHLGAIPRGSELRPDRGPRRRARPGGSPTWEGRSRSWRPSRPGENCRACEGRRHDTSWLIRRDADLRKDGAGDGALFRVFSGWGAGQLDGELEAGGWLTLPASAEHVFRSPPERLWGLALETMGGAYRFYSLMPPDPEMN